MTSASDRPPPVLVRRDRPPARTLVAALVVLTALTVWRLGSGAREGPYELVGTTMGTSFSVRVDTELSAEERARVRTVVEERLDRVNRLMSTYDTASELSRFNRRATTEPFPASRELMDVLSLAHHVSERSAGAFDVTVAPLVEAWGFGPGGGVDGRRGPKPDEALLAQLRERVGYEKLVLDPAAGTVSKTDPRATVDLSGIAKGYGVEHVADGLLELGLTSFLVEVGGELKAVGATRSGRPWRVGIERPDDRAPGIWGTVDLTEAIATSGDYRNYYEEEGVRYAHIIDPRSGSPIVMRGASVSVVHPNAAMADAWATALTVLGPEEGYAVAWREGLAALFVEPHAGGFQSLLTPWLGGRFAAVDEVR
jgi:thiamine biosynthesis lipoprotein